MNKYIKTIGLFLSLMTNSVLVNASEKKINISDFKSLGISSSIHDRTTVNGGAGFLAVIEPGQCSYSFVSGEYEMAENGDGVRLNPRKITLTEDSMFCNTHQ